MSYYELLNIYNISFSVWMFPDSIDTESGFGI